MQTLKNCHSKCFEVNGRTSHNKKCANERIRKSYLKNIEKRQLYSRTPKSRYAQGRCSAAKRGYVWGLTLEEYSFLIIDKNCHYCDGKSPETGSGLDRKDNSIGYIRDNCVPCCTSCNAFKGDHLTYAEMVAVMALLKAMRTKP